MGNLHRHTYIHTKPYKCPINTLKMASFAIVKDLQIILAMAQL